MKKWVKVTASAVLGSAALMYAGFLFVLPNVIVLNKYKNIQLTKQIDEANCITHSGKFHVDDVISTIFLSKIIEKVILLRVSSVENKNLENKIVYDIGLRRIRSSSKK